MLLAKSLAVQTRLLIPSVKGNEARLFVTDLTPPQLSVAIFLKFGGKVAFSAVCTDDCDAMQKALFAAIDMEGRNVAILGTNVGDVAS